MSKKISSNEVSQTCRMLGGKELFRDLKWNGNDSQSTAALYVAVSAIDFQLLTIKRHSVTAKAAIRVTPATAVATQQSSEIECNWGARPRDISSTNPQCCARSANCCSLFIRFSDCRRFCSCRSIRLQHNSIAFNKQAATGSKAITWKPQNSTGFNNHWNLVREQRVGRGADPIISIT